MFFHIFELKWEEDIPHEKQSPTQYMSNIIVTDDDASAAIIYSFCPIICRFQHQKGWINLLINVSFWRPFRFSACTCGNFAITKIRSYPVTRGKISWGKYTQMGVSLLCHYIYNKCLVAINIFGSTWLGWTIAFRWQHWTSLKTLSYRYKRIITQ